MAKRGPKPKENTVMKTTNEPVEPVNDEAVTEPVTEDTPTPMAPSKLEQALKDLIVPGIPVGVDSINDLNRQVQILEVRVRALEGKL